MLWKQRKNPGDEPIEVGSKGTKEERKERAQKHKLNLKRVLFFAFGCAVFRCTNGIGGGLIMCALFFGNEILSTLILLDEIDYS